jgi:hypothetical protein
MEAAATAHKQIRREARRGHKIASGDAPKKLVIDYEPRWEQYLIHKGADEHRFALVVAHRRLGKTVSAILQLVKKIVECDRPDPKGAYIFPYRQQAKLVAWEYLKKYTQNLPGYKANESELSVTLAGNRVIRLYGADRPDNLRGQYLDYVVFDEVAQMRPQVWGEIVRPMLMDRNGGAMFIGTPKGINLFYDLYLEGLKLPDWYVGIFRASDTGILPQKELDEAKRNMSPAQYQQEMECDWNASSDNTLITLDLIIAAKDKYIHPSAYKQQPRIIGVDVAHDGPDSTVIVKRQGKFMLDPIRMRGCDTIEVANRVAYEIKEWKPHAVFIDKGFNPGVIDTLKQWPQGRFVTDIQFGSTAMRKDHFANLRAEMWDNVRLWLAEGGSIPNDNDLIRDLSSPTYKWRKGDGKILLESKVDMKDRGLPSPDTGDALALTFAAPVTTQELIFEGAMVMDADEYPESDPYAT